MGGVKKHKMVQRKKAEMARECLNRKKKERIRREHAATADVSDATMPSTSYASTDATPSTSHAHVAEECENTWEGQEEGRGLCCWFKGPRIRP
ncbi:hypothetical protein Pcinc_026237 [Petrolisthes cinctipes]|uniref:Uncharacterized protein n=1 Tax=Petrolisthes cinctipes TaxID=88211 RepID=A0AAE1F744_PETCI|nr:hypothetical protein Pcinc_026237 [Petrolisthes cinctipes]